MISIIIPVYNPPDSFYQTVDMLYRQTIDDMELIIIESKLSNRQSVNISLLKKYKNLIYIPVNKKQFDNGGTRNLGAKNSKADFFVFMTQDSVPRNNRLLEELTAPFSDPDVSVVYARQIAHKSAKETEKFARMFNYPDKAVVKEKKDIPILGIKTFFASNSCSAYRTSDFNKLGGFPEKIICNEDMILAARFIDCGKKIVYNPRAQVYHSHDYTYFQQLKRNFDIGVCLKDNSETLKRVRSETEGVSFVKQAAKHCIKIKKPYLLADLLLESAFKYAGYRLGFMYRLLPLPLIKQVSNNSGYWNNDTAKNS